MPELKKGMLLYHGSYCEVRQPDLSKCAKYKDFGQGFYLTSSEEQARNFAKISTYKARNIGLSNPTQRYGFVNIFRFENSEGLNVFDYPTADSEWLHCIVAHRKNNSFPELVEQMRPYDVISGKIANDDTNASIAAYIQRVFGEIGSEGADRICIGLLLPERLKDQFCFRTDKALAKLSFEGSEKIWL